MGFSGQEYWSGLPWPPSGGLPNPGIKRRSPTLQTDSFTIWATPGKLSTKYRGRSKTLSEKQNFRRVIITVNSLLGIQEHMFQQSEGVNQKKSFQEKSGSSTKTQMKAPHWNRTAGPWSNCPNGNLRGDQRRDRSVLMLGRVWLSVTPCTIALQAPCPWDSPGKNIAKGSHFLPQGIFLTRGLDPGPLHYR